MITRKHQPAQNEVQSAAVSSGTCVGIAPTKTLAKVANFIAKKRPQYAGVCDLRDGRMRAELLPTVPVEEVVGLAVRLGERLFRDGFRYAKCGVMITELLPETVQQPALWGELDRERRERVWKTVDRLNATLGREPSAS